MATVADNRFLSRHYDHIVTLAMSHCLMPYHHNTM